MTTKEYYEHLQYLHDEIDELMTFSSLNELYRVCVLLPLLVEAKVTFNEDSLYCQLTQSQIKEFEALLKRPTFGETPGQHLNRLLTQKRINNDPDIYIRANVSADYYCKFKNDKFKKPSFNRMLRISAALRLTITETKDFLATAGFALNEFNNPKGALIMLCFNNKIYDINYIQDLLEKYKLPGLYDSKESKILIS